MGLSDQNRAIVGRDREVYTISAADLDRYLDAARAEGRPSPERLVEAAQAVVEDAEPIDDLGDQWVVAKSVIDALRAALSTPSPEAGREEGPRHPMFTDPMAWWAETGTAGSGEGCNRPFWLRREAIEYVRRHGGYVKPLYDALSPPAPEPDLFAENAKKPEPGYEGDRPWEVRTVEPSNAERNDWPETTMEYVSALEANYENLLGEYAALSKAPPPPKGYEAEPVAWAMILRDGSVRDGSVLSVQTKPYHEGFARMMAVDCGYTVAALYASPVPVAVSREELEQLVGKHLGPHLAISPTPRHEAVIRSFADAILQRLSNQQGGDR